MGSGLLCLPGKYDLIFALGTLLGLVLGIILHRFVIETMEVDNMMFGKNILPVKLFVRGAALTILFSVLSTSSCISN